MILDCDVLGGGILVGLSVRCNEGADDAENSDEKIEAVALDR